MDPETLAQSQNDGTQTTTNPAPVADPQQNLGFQKRIDELTARYREVERQRDEMAIKMAELAAAQAAPKSIAPAAPNPIEQYKSDLDPRLVEILAHQERQFQATLQERTRRMEIELGKNAIMAEASRNPALLPYATKAAQLYEQSRMQGGAPSPEEALRYVIGDDLLKRGAINQSIPTFTPTATLPPAPVPPAQNTSAVPPSNFESLPLEQQIAWMEKNGYGDMPL